MTEGRIGEKGKNSKLLSSIFLIFCKALTYSGGWPVCGHLPTANKLNAGPCWLRELTIVWIVC